MHGRRGAGVKMRKRGHSWYQSSACYILSFLSSLLLYAELNAFSLSLCFVLVFRLEFPAGYCSTLSHPLSHSCRIWEAALLPLCLPSSFLLHTLSGPAGSRPDTSSRELKVTHACSGKDEWLCHTTASWPLHFPPLQLHWGI